MEQIIRMQRNVEGFKMTGWINKVWFEIDRGWCVTIKSEERKEGGRWG